MDRLPEISGFANLVTEIDIQGRPALVSLEAAFRRLFSRHALLRSEAIEREGEWCWRELPPPRRPVRLIDVSALQGARATAIYDTLVEHERHRIFGTSEGWLRILLCKMSDTEWRLILNRHHVASDGWSFALISRDIEAAYNTAVLATRSTVTTEPPQYWEYCRYAASQSRDVAAVRYWLRKLAGAPREVRFQRPAAAAPSPERVAITHLEVPLDFLRAVRGCRVTPFAALLATLALVLCRRTGQMDLPVGTDVTTRDRPQWEQVVGLFINRVVLRVEVLAKATVMEFLQSVQQTVSDAVTFRHVPIAFLAHRLQPCGQCAPLFNVLFGLHNNPHHHLQLAGLTTAVRPIRSIACEFDLNLYFTNHARGFAGTLAYRESAFDGKTAAGFCEEYRDLATHLPAYLQWRVAALLERLEDRYGVLALAGLKTVSSCEPPCP